MPGRAFPVIYTADVSRLEAFYTALGFEAVHRFPPDDEAGYVSMQRGESSLGIVITESPNRSVA